MDIKTEFGGQQELSKYEAALERARAAHGQAVDGMKEEYALVTPRGRKIYMVYHDFEKLGPTGKLEGPGHVASVVAMQKLYLEAERLTKKDPWGLFTNGENRTEVVAAFLGAGGVHDLGNVGVATHLDWKNGRYGIRFTRLKYEDAEPVEAGIFDEHVQVHRTEWNLTEGGARNVAKIGEEMVMATVFTTEFSKDRLAMPACDQVAAILNRKALYGVFGLVNEMKVRDEKGDFLEESKKHFKPTGFLGGFVPWRFAELEKIAGKEAGMEAVCEFFDEVRKRNPDQFNRILGITGEDVKKVAQINNLQGLVEKNTKIQIQVAREFWPDTDNVRFKDAFAGWSEEKFAKMEKACALYEQHFWDENYKAEQFIAELNAV